MPATSLMIANALFALPLAMASAMPLGQALEEVKAPQPGPDTVLTKQDRARRMTVPVSVDGNGPYSFVIDTGAERTVVSRKLAVDLALEKEPSALLVSIAGQSIVEMAYVPELTMGQKSYAGLVTPILLEEHIGADGILGLDGLQDQRVVFDFTENKIHIEDALENHKDRYRHEIVVTARRQSGQLIFTDATISGIKVNVIIDTGAQLSIANPVLQKKLIERAKETGDDNLLIAVTGDTLGVQIGEARDFRIGKAQFARLPMAFANAPPFERLGMGDKPALLLGMDVLRQFDRVAIDFPERKIYFLPPRNVRTKKTNSLESRIKS